MQEASLRRSAVEVGCELWRCWSEVRDQEARTRGSSALSSRFGGKVKADAVQLARMVQRLKSPTRTPSLQPGKCSSETPESGWSQRLALPPNSSPTLRQRSTLAFVVVC